MDLPVAPKEVPVSPSSADAGGFAFSSHYDSTAGGSEFTSHYDSTPDEVPATKEVL